MIFPLNKNFIIENNKVDGFLLDYSFHAEVPQLPHPGAFGKVRRNHIHEGVDLYCNQGDTVFSMLDGEVIGIFKFTGEHIGMPWWNNTWSVLVRHKNFILNYGEILPNKEIYVGKKISIGENLGIVIPVLKKNKGRPMNMLHLEMYEDFIIKPTMIWGLGEEKPKGLMNPTNILLKFCNVL